MSLIVCDSSSIITLAENASLSILGHFNQAGNHFVAPKKVFEEVVETPLRMDSFSYEALRVREIFEQGWIELVDEPTKRKELSDKMNEIMEFANSCFVFREKPLVLLHAGEAQALALARLLGASTILVDEKTTRILIEEPLALQESMESRTGEALEVNRGALKKLKAELEGFRVIRSVELAAVAFEQGFFENYYGGRFKSSKEDVLRSVLVSLRNSGCSVAMDDIRGYMQLLR